MKLIGMLWWATPPFIAAALLVQGMLEERQLPAGAVAAAVLYLLGAGLLHRLEGRLHVGLPRLLELALIALFHSRLVVASDVIFLYHVNNARSATVLSRRRSLLYALLTAAVYHAVFFWRDGLRIDAAVAGSLFFDTLGLVLIALFANHLAAMERAERDKKAAIEDLVAQLQQSYRQLESYAAQVREMAITDEMTGLYNYRHFCESLRREAARADRTGEVFTLLFLDVDHFKRFNDTFGHPAGDRLLAEIACLLRGCVREMDLVARYGGEEFAVILPETGREEGVDVAERIRRTVAAYPFVGPGGEAVVNVTVSLGVASYPLDAATSEGLVEVADRYLYQAKTSRNRVVASVTGGPQQTRLL